MVVSKEAATWGMRFLLGFEPQNDEEIDFHRNAYDRHEDLRDAFLRTPEARALFDNANKDLLTDPSHRNRYNLPSFLLRRSELPGVRWRFEEPNLEQPVCQLCTAEQMNTETYRTLCARLGLDASAMQRKMWEFAFILASLESKGLLAPGMRGIGFGTGREPLSSVFARAGVEVLATDAPADLDFSDRWNQGAQWSNGLEDMWYPNLVDHKTFFENVRFMPADMNNISPDLRDFDFCWSACAFEHLGSIRNGLDYLHNSLETLKPGGLSVHTTEFNLQSNTDTLEAPEVSIFRKQDLELVIHELVSAGHKVEPLNLWPGSTPVDEHIDLPPYSSTHLKLEVAGFLTTSIGLIITKCD